MLLDEKVALITGAGRGIGLAVAQALANEGAVVSLGARTASEIEQAAREISAAGHRAIAVPCDVSREEDVRRMIDRTLQEFGRIDILINNAGIGAFAHVKDLAPADFDRMWSVNMRGVFLCTQAALPGMMSRGSGDIVNIASLAGRNAFAGGAGYAATKWALIGFSRCLMLEVRDRNIRVITICPGSVDTSFSGPSTSQTKNMDVIPKAGDIAQVVVDALAMPRNVMVSEIDIRPTNPKG